MLNLTKYFQVTFIQQVVFQVFLFFLKSYNILDNILIIWSNIWRESKRSFCFHKAFTLVRKDSKELIKSEVDLSASLYVQCRS